MAVLVDDDGIIKFIGVAIVSVIVTVAQHISSAVRDTEIRRTDLALGNVGAAVAFPILRAPEDGYRRRYNTRVRRLDRVVRALNIFENVECTRHSRRIRNHDV